MIPSDGRNEDLPDTIFTEKIKFDDILSDSIDIIMQCNVFNT